MSGVFGLLFLILVIIFLLGLLGLGFVVYYLLNKGKVQSKVLGDKVENYERCFKW